MIPASSSTRGTRCPSDCGLTPIARRCLWRTWCRLWGQWFVGHRRCRRHTPKQSEANWILFESIWEKHGVGQLQCIQQVEQSMGHWVSGEKALVHYLGVEPLQTSSRWTPAHGGSGTNFLATFETWMPLGNFNNAKQILWQWVKLIVNKCPSEILEARRNVGRCNRWPPTDVCECTDKMARCDLPQLLITTFMVVILRVSNGHKEIYPLINCKSCIQASGSGRSWLIPSTITEVQMSHTFQHQWSSAPSSRTNWT